MARPTTWPSKLQLLPLPSDYQDAFACLFAGQEAHASTLYLLPHQGHCILYPGATSNGNPTITLNGKLEYLHLVWWRIFHHRLPRSRLTRRCGTPGCVNPLHLIERETQAAFVQKTLSEPQRTPIISRSEKPANKPLPIDAPGCDIDAIHDAGADTTNAPDCPTETANGAMTNECDSQNSEDVNPHLNAETARMLLIGYIDESGYPATWEELRGMIPEEYCHNDMLIEVIQTEPRIAHLRPSGPIDTLSVSE